MRVSMFGGSPYVKWGPNKTLAGGAEADIINIYAKKFGFTPKLVYTHGFDGDGGLVDTVTFI